MEKYKQMSALELPTKYLSFDLEISKVIPGDFSQWKTQRPLGICCAATRCDGEEPRTWYSRTDQGKFAEKMSREDLQELVKYLSEAVQDGWQIITWNGLGFDFDVLAEESACWDICRKLALEHIDMMFHFFCLKGFTLGLDKAAKGMGLAGKKPGMSGELAPVLWKSGEFSTVLEYVAQDVVTTLEVAKKVVMGHPISWTSNSGRYQQVGFPNGWLNVVQSLNIELPDTSWMRNPMNRKDFYAWTEEKSPSSK